MASANEPQRDETPGTGLPAAGAEAGAGSVVAARARMAEALMEVAGLLVVIRDTPTLIQRVTDEVRRLFGAMGALLCRVEPRTQALEAIAVSGDVGPEYGTHMTFAPGMGTPGLAATAPAPVISRNVLMDPRIALSVDTRAAIEHAPFRAVLAVPLVLRGVVNGTLCILDREGRVFTQEEARFAQGFAHHAALVLENARLYEVADAACAEAIAANRAKDDFLAALSHELRAPLTSIYGWARMLRSGQMDKRHADRALEAIERNSVLQTQLVDDLLDVSRIIAGKLSFTPRPLPLLPIVVAAAETLRKAAEDKDVRLAVGYEGDECTVAGDALRLHQIVTNLVGNAIKFTPRGGEVDVAIIRDGRTARITVRDTGCGIPADLLPHIFERFRQGTGTAARTGNGLGLGLSIVRNLVELHGGTVMARSDGAGRGAAVSVTLPIKDCTGSARQSAVAPADEAPSAAAPSAAAGADLRGLTILVVEDDADTRELIALVLREHGARVLPAASIADAIDAFQRSVPDLLLSDHGLPDGSGSDLIQRMRDIQCQRARDMIPAIAVTGFISPSEQRRILAAGFQAHVAKPLDPYELVEIVGAALGRTE